MARVVAITPAPPRAIQWGPSIKAFQLAMGKGEAPTEETEGGHAPVIDLLTLMLTSVLCYSVDMGSGIVLGVVFEKV